MSHVFISYSKKDKEYALKLVSKLRDEGFDVWIDDRQLRSSEDWWRSIVMALWNCSAFVAVLTPDSDASKWVQREITLADQQEKPMFPLLLDGTIDTPNWAIFVRTQWQDVRGGKMPPREFFDDLAHYAPRKQQRGENVTKTGKIGPVQIADAPDNLRNALDHPPEPDNGDNDYIPVSSSGSQQPVSRFRLSLPILAAAVVVVMIAVVALSLLSSPVTPAPTPATATRSATTATPGNTQADVTSLNAWRQEQGYVPLSANGTLQGIAERHLSYLSSIPLSDLPGRSWVTNRDGRDAQFMAEEAGYPGQVEMFVEITDGNFMLNDLVSRIERAGSARIQEQSRNIGLAQERSIDTGKLYFVLILGTGGE